MKLDFGNLNNQMSIAPKNDWSKEGKTSPKIAPVAFKGGMNSSSASKFANFIKENVIDGTEAKYVNPEDIFAVLRKNFGSTFDDCANEVKDYMSKNPSKTPLTYAADGSMVLHKDPFVKNVADGVKEFTLGTLLDIGVGIRNGFRKLTGAVEDGAKTASEKGFFSNILDNREREVAAREAFYKLAGVFEQVADETELAHLAGTRSEKLAKRAEDLAKGSLKSATKKVGNYNTKSERAWNRMGTGFVSATFAGTDFYNISMLQNDDKEKATQAGRQRFFQDMRRQLLTASMTFVVLGAFQKKVNNSIPYAVLSLGGVTLLSEVVSRLMGGISLTPLSPEEARKIAEKRGHKTNKEDNSSLKQNAINQSSNQKLPSIASVNQPASVFSVFTDKYNNLPKNTEGISFTSNKLSKTIDEKKETFKGEDSKEEKKTPLYKKILGAVGVVIGASLGIGLLRTKNVFGLDSALNKMSGAYKDFTDKMTTRKLIMSKSEVDGFIQHLKDTNFTKQAEAIADKLKLNDNVLESSSEAVKKFYKGTIKAGEQYYDLGHADAKGRKIVYDVLTYPINVTGKIIEKTDNLVRALFGVPQAKGEATKIQQNIPLVEMVEKYTNKLTELQGKDKTALNKEIQNAFTRHFSETSSNNKNTSIAMLSRFLITLISGYFFVNDYRNEVLIESKGEDIDRANATMRERIGHKVSNFVLNSMFMDLFNSTFERFYLGSVPGATLVAMATEVTNETAVRASICTPSVKMDREGLIQYENERLGDPGLKGKYYRNFMKLTGKKPLSEKANKKKDNQKEQSQEKQNLKAQNPFAQNPAFSQKISMQDFIKANKNS